MTHPLVAFVVSGQSPDQVIERISREQLDSGGAGREVQQTAKEVASLLSRQLGGNWEIGLVSRGSSASFRSTTSDSVGYSVEIHDPDRPIEDTINLDFFRNTNFFGTSTGVTVELPLRDRDTFTELEGLDHSARDIAAAIQRMF